jgi:hypothetical protein
LKAREENLNHEAELHEQERFGTKIRQFAAVPDTATMPPLAWQSCCFFWSLDEFAAASGTLEVANKSGSFAALQHRLT